MSYHNQNTQNEDLKPAQLDSALNTGSNDSLLANEQKFRDLIEFAMDGIVIGSPGGIIVEVNSQFCAMLGRAREELLGKHISQGNLIFTSESLESTPFRFDRLEKGEMVVYEREILRPEGSTLTVEMRTKTMPDGSFQSFFRDVSDRKSHEQQLKTYASDLSRLNSEKDLFISILAHDLSNHFNSISGFLELLRLQFDKLTAAEAKQQIQIIDKSVKNAFQLLQDLVHWTKSLAGFAHFEPTLFKIITICEIVVNNQKYYARSKDIKVKLLIPPEMTVTADTAMVKTILRNLISNAIKFTPQNGKINISAEKREHDTLITVSDNGIGIKPAIHKRLFNDFKTFSTTGTHGEKGTGLGLIICKNYVEKHGGKIWAESIPGKGSHFKFTLPDSPGNIE